MSYSHYFKRAPALHPAAFIQAVEDIRLVFEKVRQLGVLLAGPSGEGLPELTDYTIAFNGPRECGHRYRNLGDPYPARDAHGVEANNLPVVGPWHSGALLNTRVCGGCCAGKPFVIDRDFHVAEWSQLEEGKYSGYCETSFKPYDLAVTASLIRLKERLGDDILLWSDGWSRNGFEDAKRICRGLFGFPKRFALETEKTPEAVPE